MAAIGEFRCSFGAHWSSTRSGGWCRRGTRSSRRRAWRRSPRVCVRRWCRHGAPRSASLRSSASSARYTVHTLGALTRRYSKHDFVWLMGADNLVQFHRWKAWRDIARRMPIAVIARPGYDAAALASPAMAWLRRFSVPLSSFVNRGEWSAPALVTLRFDPDERSATAIRRGDPDWALRFAGPPPRDQLTHRLIPSGEETTAP